MSVSFVRSMPLRRSAVLLLVLLLFSGCATLTGGNSPVLSRVLSRGELRVGMAGDTPPLNATNKSGELMGLEADLARDLGAAMGVESVVVKLPFGDLLGALESGKVGAYATDVWPSDPPPPDCPILKAPNVLMAPHLGASTKENLLRIGDEVFAADDNLIEGDRIRLRFAGVQNFDGVESPDDLQLVVGSPFGDLVLTWTASGQLTWDYAGVDVGPSMVP